MVYALLGTVLGAFAAILSLVLGASILTALMVYMGTGTLCLSMGMAVAAICLWRHPEQRRAVSPVSTRSDRALFLHAAGSRSH